ncbi:uncharacterized protein E0L32_002384 [Thyridium curvatum]|uniref:Protein kinase domain-containing protein n=1 Tax=Thyridium curvatum TaxID=1093900 RepID=A0A507APW8_9PEZI|nr:uncharacterized protein E0L32_002384 [Thyridium curvatum]TPX06888.1 hypothetical protein E0L32_002384 [Thyridium curvatum]
MSDTVFLLSPLNELASAVVEDESNSARRYLDPVRPQKPCLRIGLGDAECPPVLASFGRREGYDVQLPLQFSRREQCFFNFNKESGELLLHDTSEKNDTQLQEILSLPTKQEEGQDEEDEEEKTRRQCVVVLGADEYRGEWSGPAERQWLFKMGHAEFLLRAPRGLESVEAASIADRQAFARGDGHDQTIVATTPRLNQTQLSEGLPTTNPPPSTAAGHNDCQVITPLLPGNTREIRFIKLKRLGSGAQGHVLRVVDKENGNLYACKIVRFEEEEDPEPKIKMAKIKKEVAMVMALRHPHIVPYTHAQCIDNPGLQVQIFMPLYDFSLQHLLARLQTDDDDSRMMVAAKMLSQMLQALAYVHGQNPPIIHRDIKPPNILCRGDDFFLADFGLAKVVDTSHIQVGTNWYSAPEVRERGEQSPKVDIWGLGVTVAECLQKFPLLRTRGDVYETMLEWSEYLESSLCDLDPSYAPMVNLDPNHRPTAHALLEMQQELASGPTPMDWRPQTGPLTGPWPPPAAVLPGSPQHAQEDAGAQSHRAASQPPDMPNTQRGQPEEARPEGPDPSTSSNDDDDGIRRRLRKRKGDPAVVQSERASKRTRR